MVATNTFGSVVKTADYGGKEMKTLKDYIRSDFDDVNRLYIKLFEKNIVSNNLAELYLAWEMFSDSQCAQFLVVDTQTINQFVDWLNEE